MYHFKLLNIAISLRTAGESKCVQMPKYGLLTNPIYKTTEQVDTFARLGFDYAEIGMEEPYALPSALKKERHSILRALKRNNMFAIGHTAYWNDFGTSHARIRNAWIAEAKEMINVASVLRLGFLNFHFYGGSGQAKKIPSGRKMFLDNFTNAMSELSDFAERKNITLMLENIPPRDTKTAYMLKEFEYVVRNVPSLMVHLDVAHAFVEGGSGKIDEYIRKFDKRIVHIHMHDNHGKSDEHLPLGKGKINFRRVISSLKRIGYDRTITFEVFPSNIDAMGSRKLFERMWNEK